MKVSIAKIRPNPFQVRTHFNRVSIDALAREIDTLGFWAPLKVREVDGHYELCHGHRRLEALKVLKWKEVDVECVKLSDDDMAMQALVENLQREGLTDIEKAAGVSQLIERFTRNGESSDSASRKRVADLTGFNDSRISELLSLRKLSARSQQHVARRTIAGATAVVARRIGGDDMIETVVKHDVSKQALQKIQVELALIPDDKVRERVTKAVVAGKVLDATAVREQVRKVTRQTEARAGKRPPPDLHIVIRAWTQTMRAWSKKLEEVLAYRDYIEEDTKGADDFKAATRELIEKLKRFL